jgi:hypothetical protein
VLITVGRRLWFGLAVVGGAIAGYAIRRALRKGTTELDSVTRLPCTSERDVRSQASEVTLSLTFINDTTVRVSVYWIDFSGARVFYNSLEPGASYTQSTFVTHPWVAVDPGGKCLALVIPTAAGSHRVTIEGAAYPRTN